MAKNWNPKYKVNLVQVFNRAYSGESRELRDKLRPLISDDSVKFLFGQFVIDKIVNKTIKGLDKNGKKFSGTYSKEYRDSLEFRIWKSGQRRINLKLTGDMLSDIKPSQTKYTVVFGFEDQDNRNKAQGHISGKYGKRGRTSPRDFLGLTKKEEERLLREAISTQRQSSFNITADLFEAVVSSISVETINE